MNKIPNEIVKAIESEYPYHFREGFSFNNMADKNQKDYLRAAMAKGYLLHQSEQQKSIDWEKLEQEWKADDNVYLNDRDTKITISWFKEHIQGK